MNADIEQPQFSNVANSVPLIGTKGGDACGKGPRRDPADRKIEVARSVLRGQENTVGVF
ncbi:hypothetical protein JCM19039_1179 [Geomicrobium sp. JCM 19039]|nr:hypothetical protein JCM19039_1179 [Geomicrobium sp. JCM 19039]